MSVTALLVSQDVSVRDLISSLFLECRIETKTISDTVAAQALLLQSSKYSAVIVDYDLSGGELLLEDFASSPSGKSAISFALLSPGDHNCAHAANFALSKPLQAKAIRSTLNVASHMIFSSYRRTFRCPLDVAISLTGVRGIFEVRTVNISMGGIAVQMPDKLCPEDSFAIRFRLPNKVNIQTDAKVVWTDSRRAALLFTAMAAPSKRALSDWVDTEIQQAALIGLGNGHAQYQH